jgi:hypothetical protein
MLKKTLALIGLTFSLVSNAATFSLAGLEDGSTTYNKSNDGLVMTISSLPSGDVLKNGIDNFDGLDFGGIDLGSMFFSTSSFNLSFDESVYLHSFTIFETAGPWDDSVSFSISGAGVNTGTISNGRPETVFESESLLFLGGENYTFTYLAGDMIAIKSFEATAAVVPIPAAAWLFGSALIGLAGIKRKK